MNSWNTITMGELIDNGEASLQTGPFGTQFKASEYVESGIPMINVKNIGYGDVRTEGLDYLDEKTAHRLRVHRLKPGDIVFGRKGSADRHALVGPAGDGWVQGSDCMRLRLKSERITSRFLSHYFCTSGHKYWMEAVCAFGATMSTLNQGIVRRIALRVPRIEVQNKIAAILSAYDESIENNQRRIALLEKLAEEIYREWFVRLRFPGHEKVKKVKGVPIGWEVKKLGELVRTQYGYTASAETEGDGPKFLRITDIVPAAIDWDIVPHCKIEEKDEKKYLLQEGDIVVARTGATVGYAKRINKRHPKAIFASYLVRLIPNRKNDAVFLGLSVERNAFKDFITMFVTGAAQPQANATTMALFPVLHPPEPLLNEFNRIAEPILDQKEILLSQTANLSCARDQLLPRLISGKLSVENLDIQFPPGMTEELAAEPTTTAHA
jgi:type I restriction enzyme S subunit